MKKLIRRIKYHIKWFLRIRQIAIWDAGFIDYLILWHLQDMSEGFKSHAAYSANSEKRAEEIDNFCKRFKEMSEEYCEQWPELSAPDFHKRMAYFENKALKEREILYKELSNRMSYWWD